MTKKLTNAERLTALENNLGNLTNDVQALSRSVALLVNALNPTVEEAPKTKKATPVKDKPKTKKADAPKNKADKGTTLRLDKAEALELMVTSWHNRAAAAYDRRNGGNGAVKYADFTAAKKKAITADDKAKGKDSLLASKKWKDAVARHGLKVSDLKW